MERQHVAAGARIHQSYVGSSANPGYRDHAVAAEIVRGRRIADDVSFDVNPASRQALAQLIAGGGLSALVNAGARLHPPGCNGCIGMGQAPRPAAAACARCRATSPAAPAAARTRSTCAAPRRRLPPPSPA
ncbi:aconitase family protein [Streptomyces sp. CA-142005]|uniref:aconitase family protein n=1 Tax=Streptomyces sp. CA-142005 TaxID=3240052 RepID=UPI003D8C1F53